MWCLGWLSWQAYVKLGLKSIISINTNDYTEIAANLDHERMVSDIEYKWKADDMIRLKA